MGGKVKGRRLLIVLSPDEERIINAAADARNEPRATFIRRAAVAHALESARVVDAQLREGAKPGDLTSEESWLHKLGSEMLRRREWILYLYIHGSRGVVPSLDAPPRATLQQVRK